ncbi:hypothetical protein H2248_007995 [Termitomyces sp. 'cryptogamus']|nr:hypothetical protein H2248_007995 [Termitomyces sp. 'cryptogamus']
MGSILIDNTRKHVSAPGWDTVTNTLTLQGSVSQSNNPAEFTSFNITFNVPIETNPNLDPNVLVEQRWWASNNLTDAMHTLSVTNFPGNFSLDYAIVSTGSKIATAEEWMTIDNDDIDIIKYSAAWSPPNQTLYTVPLSSSQEQLILQPVDGITRHVLVVSSVPVFAKFNFTGTSVYIYGVMERSVTGNELLSIKYTLDGLSTQTEHRPTFQTQTNFLWFSNQSIPLGPHTMTIDVLEVDGIDFILDNISYTPTHFFSHQALQVLLPHQV